MFDCFYYGVCYYPEHWDTSRHASDIKRIAGAGFNFVRMGEGAWAYWEPREGHFQFEMFDRVIDLCRKHKLKVVLGTPTYAGPAWVASNYPEVLRWNFDRIPMKHGSRRFYNYTSPKSLELSDRITTALAKHYAADDAVFAWQLDNEFNCHMDVSYAPSDTIAFRAWLRKKYKTLEKLNGAWGTRFWSQTYDDWNQIDLPHPSAAYLNPHQLLDESRFISDTVVAFAKRQADLLRAANRKWLITHNALFGNIDGPALASQLDFFSHDQYPLFQSPGDWPGYSKHLASSRSFSFPFAILEQQSGPGGQMDYLQRTPSPGEMRLWAWQSIAHGAKLFSYFRWRTCPYGSEQHWHGILDPDDRDNRRLAEAKRVASEAAKLPREFFDAPVVKSVALLRDFDNEINEKRINTYARSGAGELGRWYDALMRRHVPCDVVWAGSSWNGYDVLVAPHLKIVDRSLIAKLTSFARGGGTLVLTAQAGTKDRNLHLLEQTPPGPLCALAGVEVAEWTTLDPGEARVAALESGQPIELTTFVESLRPLNAKVDVLARWMRARETHLAFDGSPAITMNRVGKGRVIYIGGYCPTASLTAFYDAILVSFARAPFEVDAPIEVEIVARKLKRGRAVTLLNHSPFEQVVRGLKAEKTLLGAAPAGRECDITLEPYGVALLLTR